MSTQFSFRFDDTIYAKIKIIAKQETRSISNLIQHLCQLKINDYEEKYGKIVSSDDDISEKK